MNKFLTVLILSFSFSSHLVFATETARQKTYAQVVKEMAEIARAHTSSVQSFVLGESDSGEKIQGLQIGTGPVHTLVVATHHGNEYGSTEVALGFARAVADAPISNQSVFVIPVLNIAGYNSKTRTEKSASNQKVYDPNRNYPSPCGTEGPFTLKDTAALDKFVSEKQIVSSATLHTFSPAVTYPWGFSTHDLTTGYESIFKGLVTEATRDSHYQTGNTSDVVYPANGSFEDYAFLQYGIWSLLFELGSTHTPNSAQIDQLVKLNVPGLRRMLESAPNERATNHAFKGKCDRSASMIALDLHNE